MKKYFLIPLCLLFIVFSNSPIYSIDKAEGLSITDEEKDWISKHPIISLGIDPEFAPFEFIAENGQYLGIASDYVKLIQSRLGLKMELVKGLTWKEVVKKAKRYEIDVLPCVGITEERKQYFKYSKPYLAFPRVIIARSDSTVKSLDDLRHIKVGIQAHSSHHGFLKEKTTFKSSHFYMIRFKRL